MSNTISAQHPAVVLRSSYRLVRTLLAIATTAILGLTIAVVVLALNAGGSTTATAAARAHPSPITAQPSVQPNPDQLGPSVTPPSSIDSHFYPGHF